MSKPLHILFLSSWYPSRLYPTRGDFVERHARATSEFVRVSNVHLVSDPNVSEGFNVEKTSEGMLDSYVVYCKSQGNSVSKQKAFFKAFKSVFKELDLVDVVHVNITYPAGMLAVYLKRKYKLPFIVTEHWTGYHSPNNRTIGILQKHFSKRIAKNAHAICPVSEQLGESMQKFGLKGNYIPIPNIVDTEIFKPSESRTSSGDEALKVLHVSNMKDEHKNVSGLLRVIARLNKEGKKVALTLVGGKREDYVQLLGQTNVESNLIHCIDQISQAELVQYFQAADIFVLFSNYENLPCVILESFSCGIPVISTDVGGIVEYFPKDFGKIIPPGDEGALYRELEIYCASKPVAIPQKMHQYARDNFSKNVVVERYLAIYENMI